MDPKDIGLISGAASAAVAAYSYWRKTQHERLRSTRTVLFYLLELHFSFSRAVLIFNSETESLVAMRRAAAATGTNYSEEELRRGFQEAFPVLQTHIRNELSSMVDGFASGIEKALLDLAKDDPVLAFRLRGQENVLGVTESIRKLIGHFAKEMSQEDLASAMVMGNLERQNLAEGVDRLAEAIEKAARRCDIWTRLGVWRVMRRARLTEPIGAELEKGYTSLLASAKR